MVPNGINSLKLETITASQRRYFTLNIYFLDRRYTGNTFKEHDMKSQMRKNRCCLSVALHLPAGFKSCGLAYEKMKKLPTKVAQFFSNSCLYGQKCNFHIGNWAEAPSVNYIYFVISNT